MEQSILEQIVVHNFQSHRKTVLELSGGVDALIGKSDAGKSSILRAIQWVVFNRPLGNAFRSSWGGKTIVTLVFSDLTKISRVKSEDENSYYLNKKKFEAVKGDVPKEIQDYLNLSAINFSNQMDAPYFLSLSPGEAARTLNTIVGLDKIDSSLSKVNSQIRKENQEIQFIENELEKLREDSKKYERIDEIGKQIQKTDTIRNQYNALLDEVEWMEEILDKIEELQKEKPKAIPKKKFESIQKLYDEQIQLNDEIIK
jgi:DNA repair exonuclease SbcCD ATPase subunit